MKTANDMIKKMQDVFAALEANEISRKDAAELVNCVGKMNGLAKSQLEYSKLRGEKPNLDFFKGISDESKEKDDD